MTKVNWPTVTVREAVSVPEAVPVAEAAPTPETAPAPDAAPPPPADIEPRDISLRTLLNIVWQKKLVFLGVVVVIFTLTVLWARHAERLYMASMSFVPVQQERSGAESALVSFMNKGANSDAQLFSGLLTSAVVSQELAKNDDLMHALFPADANRETGAWRRPPGVMQALKGGVLEILGLTAWHQPDGENLRDLLVQRLSIENAGTLSTVSFVHPDPLAARRLLEALYGLTDEALRRRIHQGALYRSDYLSKRLEQETDVPVKQNLRQMLMSERERIIMTEQNAPFAVEIVDPPHASTRPVSPKPAMVFGMAMVLSIASIGGLALVLHSRSAPGRNGRGQHGA